MLRRGSYYDLERRTLLKTYPKITILLLTILTLACSSESRVAEDPPTDIRTTDEDTASEKVLPCGQAASSLAPTVLAIAEQLQGQTIMYDSEPLSDCSGMFHRVLQSFDEVCPGYDLPEPQEARDSRDLGRWYAESGNYKLVTDELDQAHLIEPGQVLFFGQSATQYADLTLEQALTEIEHVGLVVAVDRDEAGELISYQLFHGRSPGKPAAITNYHFREPSRSSYRPFGNGDQQWIGVASIADSSRTE